LTRRGNSLAFQIRFPRDVDLDSSLAPIRVTLGPLPIREARGKVKRLAGLAELAFDRLIAWRRSGDSDDPDWDPRGPRRHARDGFRRSFERT
jgi:hypothetical protein